jgi:hypothetical protein
LSEPTCSNLYYTLDPYFAAFLICCDVTYQGVQPNRNALTFAFSDSNNQCLNLLGAFKAADRQVPVQKYKAALIRVRQELKEARWAR